MPKRTRKGGGEIVFDPEARRQYLRGFSERKRQRRAYGLAMQKVKDRKAKLEQRAEVKKVQLEQIEEAEKQKQELLEGTLEETAGTLLEEKPVNDDAEEGVETVQKYEDVQTQTQWGGEVIVTTSTKFPNDSDDEDKQQPQRKKKVDEAQQYAGDVRRYMSELKGNMPGKKKKDHHHKHKGKHGAANMKGMAEAGDMKLAQKVLSKSQAKKVKQNSAKQQGKRRRR